MLVLNLVGTTSSEYGLMLKMESSVILIGILNALMLYFLVCKFSCFLPKSEHLSHIPTRLISF